jgi:hypothetical protein
LAAPDLEGLDTFIPGPPRLTPQPRSAAGDPVVDLVPIVPAPAETNPEFATEADAPIPAVLGRLGAVCRWTPALTQPDCENVRDTRGEGFGRQSDVGSVEELSWG